MWLKLKAMILFSIILIALLIINVLLLIFSVNKIPDTKKLDKQHIALEYNTKDYVSESLYNLPKYQKAV